MIAMSTKLLTLIKSALSKESSLSVNTDKLFQVLQGTEGLEHLKNKQRHIMAVVTINQSSEPHESLGNHCFDLRSIRCPDGSIQF
jgi:hypothetical protein